MIKKITQTISTVFTSEKVVFALFIILQVFVIIQRMNLPMYQDTDGPHYSYNNFLIFKYSFIHLLEGRDLYLYHPDHYYDLYKYSPTFAVLIAPFAILPDIPGLILWNVLNCIVVFLGIWKFPNFSSKAKVLCFWFVVHELLLATQSSQSNALIAGLIILAYHQMEKKNVHWASLLLVIGFFIKPFVLVAFAMWLFFDKKWQFIAYTIGWGILLALSPLIFVSYDQFIFLYKSWLNLLANDHSVSYGLSLMGMLKAVFDLDAKLYILGIGAVLFCIPMMRIHQYKSLLFRQLFLASILIWIIIFNHRAESQTFIIAICGVAIWYFSQPYKPFNLVLLIFCLYITQLTSSEVFFPQSIRRSFIDLYEIKALPCIIIWFLVLYDLTFKKFQDYALKL